MLAQVSGAVLARLGLLFWAVAVGFVFGFMVGYAVRENISRRRRATGVVRRLKGNGIANSMAITRCLVLSRRLDRNV